VPSNQLAGAVQTQPPQLALRSGTVKATGPLKVTIDGADIPMLRLASYTPTVGDVVSVLRDGATWLCLGKPVT
jgi:hypothetical protein